MNLPYLMKLRCLYFNIYKTHRVCVWCSDYAYVQCLLYSIGVTSFSRYSNFIIIIYSISPNDNIISNNPWHSHSEKNLARYSDIAPFIFMKYIYGIAIYTSLALMTGSRGIVARFARR